VAVKVKRVASTTLKRTIFSPKWIRDVGDISTVVGVLDVSTT